MNKLNRFFQEYFTERENNASIFRVMDSSSMRDRTKIFALRFFFSSNDRLVHLYFNSGVCAANILSSIATLCLTDLVIEMMSPIVGVVLTDLNGSLMPSTSR